MLAWSQGFPANLSQWIPRGERPTLAWPPSQDIAYLYLPGVPPSIHPGQDRPSSSFTRISPKCLEGKEAVPVLMDCFSGRMVALFPAASALQFSVAWLRARFGSIALESGGYEREAIAFHELSYMK